jgi:hypothetical protein
MTMIPAQNFDLGADPMPRVEIINTVYTQMMEVTRELRGTVERLLVWGCGLLLAAVSQLVVGQVPATTKTRALLSAILLVYSAILVAVTFALKRRYDVAATSIRRINVAQRVKEQGVYLEGDQLAPTEWAHFGTPRWKEPIFQAAFVGIPFTCLTCVAITWIL